MAVIKAVNSKASIGKAVNYITKDEKTEKKLIYGKDCTPHTAIDEMKATKELWHKTEGRQYAHFVQSFNPEDKVSPELAHSIGKKFLEDDKFKGHEVVMATHVDKGHIHNHFIINSVNFEDGKKFHTQKKELESLKQKSNDLSKEHGLTKPIKGLNITSYDQKKYRAIEKGFNNKGDSYLIQTVKDVSRAISKATDREKFIKLMEDKNYTVNWSDSRKYITFTTADGKKVRNSNLQKTFKSDKFSKEGMENEFNRNLERGRSTGVERRGTPGDPGRTEGNRLTLPSDRGNGNHKRIEQADAELHKGSHERGHNEKADRGKRTGEHQTGGSRTGKEDGIDIERARGLAEELRKGNARCVATFGRNNENQQPEGSKSSGADREITKNGDKQDGRKLQREFKSHGKADWGLDR